MAFRINTVEYAWETTKTVQSGSVAYSPAAKRITIPETGSRTFLSVDLEMYVRDAADTLGVSNITSYALSCSIDGNIAGDLSAGTITATGDHMALIFKTGFTNLFNARFTGSAHTILPRWQSNANIYTGHGFRLIATYQYNDTGADTLIKTVRLPLDTQYGVLPTTQSVFGKSTGGYTNIPAMDSFLPEVSKSYQDIWVEYTGFDAAAASTVNMVTQIDSGSEVSRYGLSGSLLSDTYYFDIQTISGTIDTATPHTLKARSSQSSRLSWISPTLYATYTYRRDLSTSVMNSLILPLNSEFYNNTGLLANLHGNCSFLIPEQNPALCHSSLVICSPTVLSFNRAMYVNGTLISTASMNRPNTVGSAAMSNYRFDQNAATSSGFVLRSGYNNLKFSTLSTSTVNVSGYVVLNYSASLLDSGIYGHAKTIYFGTGSFLGNNNSTPLRWQLSPTGSTHGDITSSFYSNGFLETIATNTNAFLTTWMAFDYTGSSGESGSLFRANNESTSTTTEMGLKIIPNALDVYKSYPNQADSPFYRMDYFRRGVTFMRWPNIHRPSWTSVYFTYNQNIIRVTGSLSSCNFTTTDYAVDIYLSGSNVPISPIYNLTSSGSGASKTFMFDWYENINKLYAVTKYPEIGISNLATASNGNILTIDYGASSGGEKSFTFIG